MIYLKEFAPTAESVEAIIKKFKSKQLPRMNKLWAYYDGDHKIKKRIMQSNKPNNKLIHEYSGFIVDTLTGYFMGVNVKYSSDNKSYLEELNNILEDNFEEDENYELSKTSAIYGYAVEILYQNEKGLTRFKRIDPRQMVLVFGTQLDSFLIGGIRFYTEVDLAGEKIEYAEAYTENEVITFKKDNEKKFNEIERSGHLYGEVPIIVYKNNEENKSDFEKVLSLIDAYDKGQSDSANDLEYFADAYLYLSGYNGFEGEDDDDEEEEYRKMRERRVIFGGEKGNAQFITKESDDAAQENYKNRLNADIHKFSQTPDMTDEKFAGNLSGVAIKFKTMPMEQKAKTKENKFRTALKKRRELITNIINIRKGTTYDYREIKEAFTRNLPQNTKEKTEEIMLLAGTVSEQTLFELLPQISDAEQEMERKRLERKQEDADEYDEFDEDSEPVIDDE